MYSRPITLRLRRRHGGFSLVELLVVVAIIGILAAIIIPVIGSVRKNARNTTCLSNLRQLGVAFQAYVADHRGSIPPFALTPTNGMSTYAWGCYGGGGAAKPLNPYVDKTDITNKAADVFACPGDLAMGGIDGTGAVYNWVNYTYGSSYVVSQAIYTPGYGVSSFRMSDVKSPAKLILMGDMMMFASSYRPSWKITSWHGNAPVDNVSNVLMFDGHVKPVRVIAAGIPGYQNFGSNGGYADAEKTALWLNR